MDAIQVKVRSISTNIPLKGTGLDVMLDSIKVLYNHDAYYGGLQMRKFISELDVSAGLTPTSPLSADESTILEAYNARLSAYYEENPSEDEE